jgi:hypothetical protein
MRNLKVAQGLSGRHFADAVFEPLQLWQGRVDGLEIRFGKGGQMTAMGEHFDGAESTAKFWRLPMSASTMLRRGVCRAVVDSRKEGMALSTDAVKP